MLRNEAARETWGNDDNITRDSLSKSFLGVIDTLNDLFLRDRVDGRCKV